MWINKGAIWHYEWSNVGFGGFERIEYVKEIKETKKIDPNFFRSKSYLDIYTCSSCHQDGLAEESFKLKLP